MHFRLAFLYCDLEDYDEAMERFEILTTLYPYYINDYYEIGKDLFEQKMYKEGIRHFRLAFKTEPNHVDFHYRRGYKYIQLKN